MLKVDLIGNLGADIEVKEKDGNKFATCRVAHTDTWIGTDGVKHENTTWVDVFIDPNHKVLPYLKKGTKIYVRGNVSQRVYPSEKDRCYKAGMSVRVGEIQLLSAKKDNEQTDYTKDDPFIG